MTRKFERWGTREADAHEALLTALATRNADRDDLRRPDARFADAAAIWLAKVHQRRTKSTADTYRQWLNSVILPQLGHLRLDECDPSRIDEFFRSLERQGRSHDGVERRPYSPSTISTIRTIVAGILQQAVLRGALPRNPARVSHHPHPDQC